MNILIWILMIVGGAAGMLSTAYLVLAMPVIFGWKVYRKLKYHIGLYDSKKWEFWLPGQKRKSSGRNGWLFLLCIKLQREKCAKNKKEDVWASLKEKAGVKDGEHTQIA